MHINLKKIYQRDCSFVIIPTLLDPRYKNNFNVFPSLEDRNFNKKLLLSQMKQAMNPERRSSEINPPLIPLKNTDYDPLSQILSIVHEGAHESSRNEDDLNSQDSKMEEELENYLMVTFILLIM